MDEKGFILEYKDFKPENKDGMNIFIWRHMVNITAVKIHIRKW